MMAGEKVGGCQKDIHRLVIYFLGMLVKDAHSIAHAVAEKSTLSALEPEWIRLPNLFSSLTNKRLRTYI